MYRAAFGHYHTAGVNGDKCAKCGLDLRDPIHYRARGTEVGKRAITEDV